MMDSYCVRYRKQSKNLNSKGFVTKNKKYLVKSTCNICKSKNQNLLVNKKRKDFLVNYFPKFLS